MKKMKMATLSLGLCLALSACNMQVVDVTYGYVTLPGGTFVEGNVASWKDYEDSDMVQVVIDGAAYYTHASNVVLVNR